MATPRKRLYDIEEFPDLCAELFEGATTMISGNGVVHGFPKPLDAIDPGMISRLKEQFDARVRFQPPAQTHPHHNAVPKSP